MNRNCSTCGHKSKKSGNYCEKCGNKLENRPTYHPYIIGGGSALIILAIFHMILINIIGTSN